MKYMVYMTGKSETHMEEVVIFGDSPFAIRNSENYKDFQSDGYKEEAMLGLEEISGHACLPAYIQRG